MHVRTIFATSSTLLALPLASTFFILPQIQPPEPVLTTAPCARLVDSERALHLAHREQPYSYVQICNEMASNTLARVGSPTPVETSSGTTIRPTNDAPTTSVLGSDTTRVIVSVSSTPAPRTRPLSPNTAAVAGVTAAIAVLTTLVFGMAVYCCLRRRRQRKTRRPAEPLPAMCRSYRSLHDEAASGKCNTGFDGKEMMLTVLDRRSGDSTTFPSEIPRLVH